MAIQKMTVSGGNLHAGDVLENGATIERVWVAANPAYVLYEFVGGGVRTAGRAQKFLVAREVVS